MFDSSLSVSITNLAVAFVPVLLGIILHEVAHGWAASLCGDHTARMLGRLTLNPVPHIDPMGLAMFVLTALASPFVFGWAKPVPVNPRNMRNPERGMLLVSVAGPLANMLLAFVCAGGAALMWRYAQTAGMTEGSAAHFLLRMFVVGTLSNFALAWINLVPIPPLDGSHIVESFLPRRFNEPRGRLGRCAKALLTFIVIDATWLLFRAHALSTALHMAERMVRCAAAAPMATGFTFPQALVLAVGLAALGALDALHERGRTLTAWLDRRPAALRMALMLLGVLAVCALLWLRVGGRPDVKRLGPYLLCALLPIAWYMALLNHSAEHAFFTYRALCVTIFAAVSMAIPTGKAET